MQVLISKITKEELSQIASSMYGHLVKAVVDINKVEIVKSYIE